MSRPVRWCCRASAFGLSLVILLGLSARGEDRAKEVAEIKKKLAELNKKLAELQAPAAKPLKALELKDALAWKSVRGAVLSRDGKWFACGILDGEGKMGETLVRQTDGSREHRFPEGSFNLAFSPDSRWVAFATVVPMSGERRRPRAAAPPSASEAPKPRVVLLELASGNKVEYEGISRFTFAGEAGNVLAVHKPATTQAAATEPRTTPAPTTPSTRERARGSDLILRDLATGKELTLGNVAEFAFDKMGDWLALLIDAQGEVGNGVQLRNMKTGVLHQLDSGKASYRGLAWSEKGDAFALLKGVKDKKLEDRLYSVLAVGDLTATPVVRAYDPAKDAAFPKGMTISPSRPASFSEDLGTVFFGIHEPKKAGDRTEAAGDPTRGPAGFRGRSSQKPDLVIWHWNDDRLQAHQEKEAARDRAFSYVCAYRFAENRFLRLADDTLRDVTVAPKGRWAVGFDDRATRRSRWLDGRGHRDVYVIDVQTGRREQALKGLRDFMGISPEGTHFLYHSEGHFHACDMATRTSRCLSRTAATSFINTEDDHNVDRPPTRPIGWAKDGKAVLVSDNWDIWKLGVADEAAVNLTADGKKRGIRYGPPQVFDQRAKGLDLAAPLVVPVLEEWTKKAGYVRIDPKGGATRLLWGDAGFGGLIKAKDAEVYAYTRESVAEFPDYYLTDAGFKSSRRLTTANPQQERFRWSSGSLLVDYKSTKGDHLQGALFLPAGYEKGKKYPTVVYIYERLSQGKNRYPQPRSWGFSPAVYTSNGYAVLMPDIKYRVNDPGLSAVWCVLPALDAAVATGVVDKDRVGLHGHSWGGYQTAFLITQTPRFKAAVAGAPLTNLVSMYSSIYWNVGIPNQPIFESSQGRFTAPYTELLEAYLRNSPVIHARNVKTPLMLLHNDKDGAVDFNQGIEYFNTLRRLNKPVVMLQYKGENHGLAKPANQKDYSVRMREFFDHHLLGKAAPAWLEKGVPHLKIDEHLQERAKEK